MQPVNALSVHEAAVTLYSYLVSNGANWGTKSSPSANVRAAQQIFGITADGIFGPQTRAVMKTEGVEPPPRPANGVTQYDSMTGLGPISW